VAWNHRPTGRASRDRDGSSRSNPYLRQRVAAYPGLTGSRLLREIRERGYRGGYTAVTDFLREVRPAPSPSFEVRFETPPGHQAQVDFAQFQLVFTDEPSQTRIVWLFSLVLGYSRLIWARFVMHQDLQTVLRCHLAAFAALGGVPQEILYDRMKTAVRRCSRRRAMPRLRRFSIAAR
jgi:transposase